MSKKIFLQLIIILCMHVFLCFYVSAEEIPEILLEDNFESYGIDGNGMDESGKAINPVMAENNGGCWFNEDASSKRGTIIHSEIHSETKVNHYLALWKQTKPEVVLTSIAKEIGQEQTVAENKEYTFTVRVNLPKYDSYLASAGCNYELALSETAETADNTNALQLAAITSNKDTAAISLGGTDTGKVLSPESWYELKVVIAFINEKAYLSTYINSEPCVEYSVMNLSKNELEGMRKYLTVKADLNGILDKRAKETIRLDDISFKVRGIAAPPLIASFSPETGSMVTDSSAPLLVDFGCEIENVTKYNITIDNGARVESVEMNEFCTGFEVRFAELTEGTLYNVSLSIARYGEDMQTFEYIFTYTGNRERYVYDWFNSYGINGSGQNENGQAINPISATERYGVWYDKEASSKRGAVILQDENKVPALVFCLQSQNKVIRTQMSSLLKSDASALGIPNGVYELNTGFIIPYGSDAAGLRGDCYAKVSIGSENIINDLFCIDYAGGKNRIRFLDSDKTADLNENQEYFVKIIIYPEKDKYTADAFITDESNGTVQVLNHVPVQINELAQMKRLLIDVNGYDSQKFTKIFVLKGIDFQCSFTPKLLLCDASGEILSMENNTIIAEFDTPVPEEVDCYSINNGAQVVKAERLNENKIMLKIDGLKNSEKYVLCFPGVKNADGYSCLDSVMFSVENKIVVTDIALENGQLTSGENKLNVKLNNTTDEQLTAVLVLLVCIDDGSGYKIEEVVTEKKENISNDDSFSVSFSLESNEKRFIKVFLLDDLTDMRSLYDEVQYR